jgi:hypothetical protein
MSSCSKEGSRNCCGVEAADECAVAAFCSAKLCKTECAIDTDCGAAEKCAVDTERATALGF